MLLFEGFAPWRAILQKFPPRRSGCVRSAKLTGDQNMLAVWCGTAVQRTRLSFLRILVYC